MPSTLKSAKGTITFSERKDIDLSQLVHLYQQAPWAKDRTLEQAQEMLKHTDVVISAWDGDRLVGFGRVLTDYLPRLDLDVVVHKDYQSRRIGTELVERILHHPNLKTVELFWLNTRMPGFYERLGFSSRTRQVWSGPGGNRPASNDGC